MLRHAGLSVGKGWSGKKIHKKKKTAQFKVTKVYIPAAEFIELFRKESASNFVWIDWLTRTRTRQCWAPVDDEGEAQA